MMTEDIVLGEKGNKMPTINIKDIPKSEMVRLVDLTEDSINKIAEAVVQKLKERERWRIWDGGADQTWAEYTFQENTDG